MIKTLEELKNHISQIDSFGAKDSKTVEKIWKFKELGINLYHLTGPIGSGKTWYIENVLERIYSDEKEYAYVYVNVSEFDFIDQDRWMEIIYRIQFSLLNKTSRKASEVALSLAIGMLSVFGKAANDAIAKKTGFNPVLIIDNIKGIKNDFNEIKNKIYNEKFPKPKSFVVNSFKEWLNNYDKKVVIVLDELDRTNPDFSTNILDFSKHLQCENTILIVSYDYEIISSYLQNHYHVPNPSVYISKYNDNNVIEITKKVGDTHSNLGKLITKFNLLENVRDWKNILGMNYVDLWSLFNFLRTNNYHSDLSYELLITITILLDSRNNGINLKQNFTIKKTPITKVEKTVSTKNYVKYELDLKNKKDLNYINGLFIEIGRELNLSHNGKLEVTGGMRSIYQDANVIKLLLSKTSGEAFGINEWHPQDHHGNDFSELLLNRLSFLKEIFNYNKQ